MVNVEQE